MNAAEGPQTRSTERLTLKSNCKILYKLAETQLLKKFHINFTRDVIVVIDLISLNKRTLLGGVLEPKG